MIYDFQFSPPFTLTKRKGKMYVCVTVPLELRPFYSEKQIRRSTGTIDKAVDNGRAALKYAELLADLKDKASWLDPFIEGIRKNLSRHAIDVAEWYRSGTLSAVLVGVRLALRLPLGSRGDMPAASYRLSHKAFISG